MVSLLLVLAATPVTVVVEGCPCAPEAVQRLTELELRRGPPRSLPVSLACDASGLSVRVEDPLTRKVLSRAFPQAEVPPNALERFAALAIAELVEASWAELLLPARVSSGEQAVAVEALPHRRVRVLLFGAARWLPTGGVWQGGGGVRGHVGLSDVWGVTLDVMAESGRRAVTGGQLGVDGVSASAALTARLEGERWTWLAGVGARGLGARLVGLPAAGSTMEGRTLVGFLGGPDVLGEVSVTFGPVELSLALEAGWLINAVEARADGVPLATLGGPWAQASLGLGWRW